MFSDSVFHGTIITSALLIRFVFFLFVCFLSVFDVGDEGCGMGNAYISQGYGNCCRYDQFSGKRVVKQDMIHE